MILLKNNKGFTLIELIVSVAIISIISSIMVANYRHGGSSEELNIAAQNLVSEIRKAQGYALSYREYNGVIYDEGGWGVRLTRNLSANPENFTLFFDVNNYGKSSAGEIFIDKPIGNNVVVSDISSGGSHSDYFWAIFYPPNPKIMLRGDNDDTDDVLASFTIGVSDSAEYVEIELTHSRGATKTIILNKFGLIDVE